MRIIVVVGKDLMVGSDSKKNSLLGSGFSSSFIIKDRFTITSFEAKN